MRVPCGYGSQLEASPLLEVKGVSKRHTGNYIPTGSPPACSLGYVIVIEAIKFPGLVAASGIMINIYYDLSAEKGIRYIVSKTNASLKL